MLLLLKMLFIIFIGCLTVIFLGTGISILYEDPIEYNYRRKLLLKERQTLKILKDILNRNYKTGEK